MILFEGCGAARETHGPEPRAPFFITNPPDPPLLPVYPFRIGESVLIARVFVAPVHHPEEAIRAGLDADGAEPAVVGAEEVADVAGFKSSADGVHGFFVYGVVVDVAKEGVAVGIFRIDATLIDRDAGIGGAEVPGVLRTHDAGKQLVGVGIFRCAALTGVESARGHVEEVVDDAGFDKGIATGIEIDAPGIAGAIRKHFVIISSWAVIFGAELHAENAGIQRKTFLRFLFWTADLAIGKDAVGQIHPAIRTPGETVQQFMPVLQTKTSEDRFVFVGLVVAVGVTEEENVRSLPDKDTAVATEDSGGKVQAFGKNGALVGFSVVVGVFQNDDAVAGRVFFLGDYRTKVLIGCGFGIGVRFASAVRVFIKFHDPKTSPVVPRHGDWIDDHGFAGKAADGVTLRHRHLGNGLFYSRAGTGSRRPDAVEFLAMKQGGGQESGQQGKSREWEQQGAHNDKKEQTYLRSVCRVFGGEMSSLIHRTRDGGSLPEGLSLSEVYLNCPAARKNLRGRRIFL